MEITALRTNLTSISDVVTVGGNLQWFTDHMVEKAFISQRAARGILDVHGVTSAKQASQLMDSVFAKIRVSEEERHWFNEFVDIFSHDAAYSDLVRRLKRAIESSH